MAFLNGPLEFLLTFGEWSGTFYTTEHILFMVIWRRPYGKGPLKIAREETLYRQPHHGLHFPIQLQGTFYIKTN